MANEKKKKKPVWLIPATLIVLLLIGTTVLAVSKNNQKKEAEKRKASEMEQTQGETSEPGVVTWNGKEYVYNEHLSNFLFLGIDKREQTETKTGQADAGQADALFLVSWDRVKNDMTLISIPRDTMTEIKIYGKSGESLGTNQNHISLSYGYGDGKDRSCNLTKEAVSNLFYGVPIQGYCSISMDGIPVLVRSVGGLTVTVPNDSLQEKFPEFAQGQQITLNEENTETFVRYRDITKSQSAIRRLERQQEFLNQYARRAKQAFAENPGFISQMYLDLEPYMVTNMSTDQFVKLMEGAMTGGDLKTWTVPGEGVEGEMFDEYYVDDKALYEQIMRTFYIEKE